jgi:hypothetical protein
MSFGALELHGQEGVVSVLSVDGGRFGGEAGEDGEGFQGGVVRPREATMEDGVDSGQREADGTLVYGLDNMIEVQLGLGNIAMLEELGVGAGGLLAGYRVASFVKGAFRHEKDHRVGKWF